MDDDDDDDGMPLYAASWEVEERAMVLSSPLAYGQSVYKRHVFVVNSYLEFGCTNCAKKLAKHQQREQSLRVRSLLEFSIFTSHHLTRAS